MKLTVLSTLALLFCPSLVSAATIAAASCADTNVQAAIGIAAAGDTVTVPAGSCTWTKTVTIVNKGITLQGAGIGVTNITDQGSGGAALAINGASATNFVTVTGFTFIKSSNHSDGIIQVSGVQAAVAFRIHHNRILMATQGSRGIYPESVYGLIDHNTFDVTASTGSIQMISVNGSSFGSDGGFTPWTRPLTLGTNQAVYIEDNIFTYGSTDEDAIDTYAGARFVIRYNTFINAHIGWHGTDSGGIRSPVSHEVYNNTFTNNTGSTFRAGTIRGGTGVWFNNTYGGSHGTWGAITIMLYRVVQPSQAGGWQVCNGSKWELGSTNWSANESRIGSLVGAPQRVKWCSGNRDRECLTDATCTSTGSGTCSTYLDGSGTAGYPCRDQPGRGPGQVLAPIYAWNNTAGVTLSTYDGGSGISDANYLQPGRDYVNGSAPPGYTAYTYPHPLQGAPPTSPPPSPTNLNVGSP